MPGSDASRVRLSSVAVLDAMVLAKTAQTGSLDAAAVITVNWSRRRLLDAALALAMSGPQKSVIRHPQRSEGQGLEEACWTPNELKRAHSDYSKGVRSALVMAGERIYQRQSKRQRRAS